MSLWPRRRLQRAQAPDQPPVLPPERGLFIVGAARSGTTVLQNALNHAPEIFLFGEPDLHMEVEEGNFASRYNAMHRSWGNQKTKSTFCPPVLAQDGSSDDYLNHLAGAYRWVGSKIVVNKRRGAAWMERLTAYHCQRFYTGRYLFTFRHPLSVVRSTQGLQVLTGMEQEPLAALLDNYLEVVGLFLCALRNLPHVRAVFHEDMSVAEMARIGEWLQVDLSGAVDYYEKVRTRSYENDAVAEHEHALLQPVLQIYADLRRCAGEGFAKPQLEQNDNNFAPGHYTDLGALVRRVKVISESLMAADEGASS